MKDDYTMGEYWKDVKPIYKQKHDERVSKTPDRIQYSMQKFIDNNMLYSLKNRQTGQFNLQIGSDLIVYYCSTGKILLNNKPLQKRGIGNVIQIYKNLREDIK